MSKGILRIYYGEGRGKSTAALGTAIRQAACGKNAAIISFYKEKNEAGEELLKKLEPELKFFHFEDLRNGFQYGKKVISTGGYELLVLDEVLGLVESTIISEEELIELVSGIPEDMVVICTGRNVSACIKECADELYQVTLEK